MPCVVKPVMSTSGKGQSVVRNRDGIEKSWNYAQAGGRVGGGRVIVEGFIDFEYEITLLTLRHVGRTSFCAPIGHRQVDGDYRGVVATATDERAALVECERIARLVTGELGGLGIFGVEFFIRGDQVWFSEVSPRPHDTGMVTMISQDLSQFALHARAILGLPVPQIEQRGPSASAAILVEGESDRVVFENVAQVLAVSGRAAALVRQARSARQAAHGCCARGRARHRRCAREGARGRRRNQAASRIAKRAALGNPADERYSSRPLARDLQSNVYCVDPRSAALLSLLRLPA